MNREKIQKKRQKLWDRTVKIYEPITLKNRTDFIEDCLILGFEQVEIARYLGISKQRVQQILDNGTKRMLKNTK